jgi:GMP reductase
MHRFDLDNVAVRARHAAQGRVRLHLAGREGARPRHGGPLAAEGLVPEYITIDIAHGHADSVRDMIGYIKAKLPAAL